MAIIEHLVSLHLPLLLTHLKKLGVGIEMFASDWIFALFTNVIPVEQVQRFLT